MLRSKNNDQLAAYLATGVAGVLEKQQLRNGFSKKALEAAVAGSFVLGPLPLTLPLANKRQDLVTAEMHQRVRVALSLLHDAGYDITEAPKAWWLLNAKESASLDTIAIPDDAIYAYAALGATRRNTDWEQQPGAEPRPLH